MFTLGERGTCKSIHGKAAAFAGSVCGCDVAVVGAGAGAGDGSPGRPVTGGFVTKTGAPIGTGGGSPRGSDTGGAAPVPRFWETKLA